MPYAKIRGATSALDVLAKTVAIPRDHRPIRLPTYPALERTACLSFTDTLTVPVPAGSNAYAAVIRDPALPLWSQCYVDATSVGDYATPAAYSVFRGIITEDDPYTIPTNSGPFTLPITGGYYAKGIAVDKAAGDATLISRIPFVRYDGNIYMAPVADNLAIELITTGGTITAGTYSMSYEYVYSGMVRTNVFEGSLTIATSSIHAFATNSLGDGYRCPLRVTGLVLNLTAAAGVVLKSVAVGLTTQATTSASQSALSSPTTLSNFCFYPIARASEVGVTDYPWLSTRATAVGALFTNVTAALSKEGTVEAGRCNAEDFNFFDVSDFERTIDGLYPKDRYFGAMENGLYTFTLPDSGSEVMRDCFPLDNKTNACFNGISLYPTVIDLSLLHYANLIMFKDLGSTASTIAVTLDRHIEFRSTSVLFPVGFSTLPLETFHAAQMALVRMGVFFENPVHLAAIAGLVRTAVQAVAPYVMPVVRSAGRAALSAGTDAVLSMAKKKMGDMQQSTVNKSKPRNAIVVTRKAKAKRKGGK